ncbi:MAG: hypothetical protein AB1435_17300, partial [Chloroflexota bacterium]
GGREKSGGPAPLPSAQRGGRGWGRGGNPSAQVPSPNRLFVDPLTNRRFATCPHTAFTDGGEGGIITSEEPIFTI